MPEGLNEKQLEKESEMAMLKQEIFEKAGSRSLEESEALIESCLDTTRRERYRNEGTISRAETLSDLGKELDELNKERAARPPKEGKIERKKLTEGAVEYKRIENDALVIDSSDTHGTPDDLKKAISEFLERKLKGENVYFNYGGDIGSGKQQIEVLEMLSVLKKQFPDAVSIESGNGDRRGSSLFNGLATQMTEKFSPRLAVAVDQKVQEIFGRLKQEIEKSNGKLPDLSSQMKKGSWLYNTVFGAQLLRAGREAGAASIKPDDFNPEVIYRILKTISDLKPEQQSNVLTNTVLRQLVFARAGMIKMTSRKQKLLSDRALDPDAKKITEMWQTANNLFNEQNTHVIMENDNGVIVGTHSGCVRDADELGKLVYDPVRGGQAGWNKFYPPDKIPPKGEGIERYGDNIHSYTTNDFGEHWGKFADLDKPLIVMVGHNHGNYTEKIPLLDKNGQPLGRDALRVEVASGRTKNPEPKYVVIDTAKLGEEEAVEYKSV